MLEVAYNGLRSVSAVGLEGLRGLRVLQLEGNSIDRVDVQLSDHCPLLRHLSLARNGLRKLDPAVLEGLTELEGLQLEDNQLRLLPLFPSSLTSLRALYLASNRFAELIDIEGWGPRSCPP